MNDDIRKRRTPVAKPPLPHERDQTPETKGKRRNPEIAQAERDLRNGQVDTDNYTRVRNAVEGKTRR
jgi:hypothetical protein